MESWKDGRKVHPKYFHPLDTLALDSVNEVCQVLRRAFGSKLTPNMITTVGNLLRFTGVWLFYQRQCALEAALFTLLGGYCDFLDGHYARKYDMVTTFGDYYDHLTDWMWAGSLIAIFYFRYSLPKCVIVTIIAVLGVYVVHFGAREALREAQGTSPTVQFTRWALFGCDPDAVAAKLRYVNSDMLVLVAVAGLVYWAIRNYRA